MTPGTVAIVMMIAPDHDLEWQAVLLGASVRQFVTRPVNLYFCIEADHLPLLGAETRALIDRLGGVLRPLPSGPVFEPAYAIGNKMRACAMDYEEERVIFLDSDMMFSRPSDLSRITQGDVALQQEFGQVWTKQAGADGQWAHLYRRFGIPGERIDALRARAKKFHHPYFNAGAISFSTASGFGPAWLETSVAIDADAKITHKRPWLDQIALPVTALRKGLDLQVLPHFVNKRPTRDTLPQLILAHYHGLVMMRLSFLSRIADRCVRAQLGLRSLEHLLDLILRHSARAQAARLKGKAPFAKVFGERNTGTNLVESLLRENFRTLPLVPRSEGEDFLRDAASAFGKVPEYRETSRDLLHQATMDTLYGWKHARPDAVMLSRLPRYEQTKFICIYKHPAFWLKSLHARPYNEFHGKVPKGFADFLSETFTISERDMLPYTFSGTPLEIYQEKLRGYLALKHQAPDDTLIVPYEQMLARQDDFLKLLSAHFVPNRTRLLFPTKAAKAVDAREKGLSTADYIRKYAPENRFVGFDDKARKIYEAGCDTALFDTLSELSCFA